MGSIVSAPSLPAVVFCATGGALNSHTASTLTTIPQINPIGQLFRVSVRMLLNPPTHVMARCRHKWRATVGYEQRIPAWDGPVEQRKRSDWPTTREDRPSTQALSIFLMRSVSLVEASPAAYEKRHRVARTPAAK
jgi:hypothetical protein